MRNSIRTLRSEVQKHIVVLSRLEEYIVLFDRERLCRENPSVDQAMIVAQALTNYYTCLETIFLRISRFFENSLPGERWHKALLEKMTLEIKNVRVKVVRDDVYLGLLELLKFRHFSRYYFELDYDWDKLLFLLNKFHSMRMMIQEDLANFEEYLEKLGE